MRVLIVGDLHGHVYELARFLESGADLALQVGDFGYWPRAQWVAKRLHSLVGEKGLPFPVHFCDGNHEDHHALNNLRWGGKYGAPRPEGWNDPPRAYRVAPGVFWQSRGSTLTLPDGRVVLFVGGAWSVDWSRRRDGVSWFKKEEILSEWDYARFPDVHVDIVVSHTSPHLFGKWEPPSDLPFKVLPDPSQDVLDKVFEKYRPSLWFFGHFHRRRSGEVDGCKWQSLGAMDGSADRFSDGCFVLE